MSVPFFFKPNGEQGRLASRLQAALDVHHARIFGRCETQNGIQPFDRLVEQVMTRPPYNDARRVFWIVDNCSAHRGAQGGATPANAYPQLVLIHAPVHASWQNQVEIDFSIAPLGFGRPMISQTWIPSPNACLIFNATGNRLPDPLNGSSTVKT